MVRTGSLDRCKRVLYLNERLSCNRFLLVIRHQNDTSFHDLYSDMLSGIKPRRVQLLARKDDFQRRLVENIWAISHNQRTLGSGLVGVWIECESVIINSLIVGMVDAL